MLESKEVNQEIDCVIADCSFASKIHKEMLAELGSFMQTSDPIAAAVVKIATNYGAEAYTVDGTHFYMFRFKSKQDKLAFILKNV